MVDLEYIVIQAGGKGTRLGSLTVNKPKAIVSVGNLPLIYHLFRKYPNKKYIVIADYHKDILVRYLEAFPEVQCIVVGTDGNKGTCSGIQNALDLIPQNERFMLIWSDLVLGDDFTLPSDDCEYLGISESFECRWSYSNYEFIEAQSVCDGVAGLFIFKNKGSIGDVPTSGEFVRWLQSKNHKFERLGLKGAAEYGLLERIKPQESGKCRPFNSMRLVGNKLLKEGIDDQGKTLAVREINWYKHVKGLRIPIPEIFSYEPLTMEYIDGKNVFDYDMSYEEKVRVLSKIMGGLKEVHKNDLSSPDYFSIKKAYFDKTFARLDKVRNLIPKSNDRIIVVNGKQCRNVFYHIDELRDKISKIRVEEFCLIHGDCTFSNIVMKGGKEPIFIDPRGYFGNQELIGDPNYDWAKLYYSIVGDYDQFNLGRFDLRISDEIDLKIRTNGWSCVEEDFISMLPENVEISTIRLIHALIWLSLTTYAWDDYDSICGAFYNGLYYLEDSL